MIQSKLWQASQQGRSRLWEFHAVLLHVVCVLICVMVQASLAIHLSTRSRPLLCLLHRALTSQTLHVVSKSQEACETANCIIQLCHSSTCGRPLPANS